MYLLRVQHTEAGWGGVVWKTLGLDPHIVNVNGGATYLWGDYDPANESFTPFVPSGASAPKTSILERAQGGWWGAQNANGRMLMIGWALGTTPEDSTPHLSVRPELFCFHR